MPSSSSNQSMQVFWMVSMRGTLAWKKVATVLIYFYLLTSFINTVMRNISYRYFLFFSRHFYYRRLKLVVIFESNSITMSIYKFMNESLQAIHQVLYLYFVKGNQNELLISQKRTLLPFLPMTIESQKTVCQGFYHHLHILSSIMVGEDTLDLQE